MQIFLLSKKSGKTRAYSFRVVSFFILAFFMLPLLGVAFYFGSETATLAETSDVTVATEKFHAELDEQKKGLLELQQTSQSELNALALRLGQLQSQMLRLNAVGLRITQKAGIDEKEFDFSSQPAVGGLSFELEGESQDAGSLQTSIDQLFTQLQEKEQQLGVLDSLLRGKAQQKEFRPTGRPIEKGWLSSHFGKRIDPFTGRKAWHHGVDFAGKEGSSVIAIASGVVVWAAPRKNYGNMIEIDHGKGYVTRYGHNKEILVQVGDAVKQGEAIAKMGSTGRSTGPHVHLEVLRNGRKINPARYIRASR